MTTLTATYRHDRNGTTHPLTITIDADPALQDEARRLQDRLGSYFQQRRSGLLSLLKVDVVAADALPVARPAAAAAAPARQRRKRVKEASEA